LSAKIKVGSYRATGIACTMTPLQKYRCFATIDSIIILWTVPLFLGSYALVSIQQGRMYAKVIGQNIYFYSFK
jgi:hypothetical protein